MDFNRDKRARATDSPGSSSDDPSFKLSSETFRLQPEARVASYTLMGQIPSDPSEIPQFPSKKPKLFEFDTKKSAHRLPSGISSSLSMIQDSIRTSDFSTLLISLKALSTELTMTNDDHLSSLPIDILTETLIFTLNTENAEIVLHGIICINFLIDSHHAAVTYFVKAGIINLLIGKIMNIEYIDVAEYAVKSLEKISHEFPEDVLKKTLFCDILPMLEFFDLSVQKKMLGILLNVSKSVGNFSDFQQFLKPCLPVLVGLMQNKVKDLSYRNEKTAEILVAIIESLRSVNEDETICTGLLEYGIILIILEVLNEFSNLTGKCFKLLASLCRGSLKVLKEFLLIGLENLKKSLNLAVSDGNSQILTEALHLVYYILPAENDKARKDFFYSNPEPINQLSGIIFPRIHSIYELLNKKVTKILLLDLTYSLMCLSSTENLLAYLNFSSFLSGLLAEKEGSILKGSLKIISILYDKVPKEVSASFIREGVVSRFKALKNPENLRFVSDERYSEPYEFEQFLINYRRSRAMSDHQDIHISRPRLLSESRDGHSDQKKEIICLSKSIIEKHNACENNSAFTVSKLLKNLSNSFEQNSNDAKSLLTELLKVLKNYSPTAYELNSSNLASSLWSYLSCKHSSQISSSRIQEFLQVFHIDSGGADFNQFLSLFFNAFTYLDHYVISFTNKQQSRGYSQRMRISMLYVPNPDLPPEFNYIDSFFKSISKFSISPDPTCPIIALKSMLKRVRNKKDLLFFKDSIRDEVMDLEDDPETQALKLVFLSQDLEISNELLIGDLIPSLNDSPILKFKFTIGKEKSVYLAEHSEIFENFIKNCNNVGLDSENPAFDYLRFINFLFLSLTDYPFERIFGKPDLNIFISQKLNGIVSKQLSEPIYLARRILPTWMKELPKHCWFLFSYPTRLKILDNLRQTNIEFSRGARQKVRVDRGNVLEGAQILMNDLAFLQQGMLEVNFDEEIGTGNGPTLEFFALLAQEIRNLGIWRKSTLLFPSPHQSLENNPFFFIGRVVGKAILDKRYVEIPLNPVFWKMVQRKSVCLKDIQQIDSVLYKTLSDLEKFADQYEKDQKSTLFNGVTIEELHLFFTLPAYESIELIPGGKHIQVNLQNLKKYIHLVAQETLLQLPQINAFRDGLCSLIPIESLLGFSPIELEELICGCNNEVWDLDTLRSSIKPAHGYNENSSNFQNLLKVMNEFDSVQQRNFLQFTTGCPRLPLGGFFGLSPCLTVVKKEDGDDADKYLPSVMTCQNYLKLPNYSSLDILKKNLYLALEEGHHTFHLS